MQLVQESDAAAVVNMAQTKAELETKIRQLSALMAQSGVPGAQAKMALLSQKAATVLILLDLLVQRYKY